ncbi:hypothetical protein FACS189488_10760 [Betaproteobacteria bacterium]|nr:hypothetical protein FACS189488_10760 [Betaproteobacteria bacterium]
MPGDDLDPTGRIFCSDVGQVDLADVSVLHTGLDTVKQLYAGMLKPDLMEELQRITEEGAGECLNLGGLLWLVGYGGKSGYKYRLQNSDEGLIVFIKSNFADVLTSHSHVKIECSPHWLHPRSADVMQKELDSLAGLALDGMAHSGVAVHICVDFQGWSPEQSFVDCLVTRSKRVLDHRGGNVSYINTGEVGMVFDRSNSYRFGSPAGVEMALYRKDQEIKARDKVEFWHAVWRDAGDFEGAAFNPDEPVWRLEFRYHHAVVAQFGRGAAGQKEFGFSIVEREFAGIAGVSKHLQGFWKYGLNSFRLQVYADKHSPYIDPMWQLLRDDVVMGEPQGDLAYKRVYKPATSVGGVKNLMLAAGNLLSMYARHRFTVDHVMKLLKHSGIYDDLWQYFFDRACRQKRPMQENELRNWVAKGLLTRTLMGKAA